MKREKKWERPANKRQTRTASLKRNIERNEREQERVGGGRDRTAEKEGKRTETRRRKKQITEEFPASASLGDRKKLRFRS